MTDNYAKIIADNLSLLFHRPLDETAHRLQGSRHGEEITFTAFGETCRILPDGIVLGARDQGGPLGIVISLYALSAGPEKMIVEPFRAFKEFAGTTPYHGAFATHTERILVPRVSLIQRHAATLTEMFGGHRAPESVGGDFAFVVFPFPKIALCYIFYLADEDFPASATCLFSRNADRFIPSDGLADTGEYMSKKLLSTLEGLS